MKRGSFRPNCVREDPCCEEVECCGGSFVGLEQSTRMAHQAIDLVGGLVGLMTGPVVAGLSGSRNHGKGCQCGCHAECGTPRPAHAGKFHATTDIKLEAQLGEQRIISFLVENNRQKEAAMTFKVGAWLDAYGRSAAIPVEFSPPKATLKPGEVIAVRALVKVAEPVETDRVYYTEIVLDGCSRRPISIGLLVQSKDCHAYFALCDACRPQRGRFVEFCQQCGCEDTCGCGASRGCDPHHHWFDSCSCAWYYRAS